MNLLEAVAGAYLDGCIRGHHVMAGEAEHRASETLKNAAPTGWLVEFPKGTVFIEDEVLMRINLANGYKCVPLFAGEAL